jgi:hypothetical protein
MEHATALLIKDALETHYEQNVKMLRVEDFDEMKQLWEETNKSHIIHLDTLEGFVPQIEVHIVFKFDDKIVLLNEIGESDEYPSFKISNIFRPELTQNETGQFDAEFNTFGTQHQLNFVRQRFYECNADAVQVVGVRWEEKGETDDEINKIAEDYSVDFVF